MKWFFALNQMSLSAQRGFWQDMIRVAVKSALQQTSLSPHFVFDGDDDPFLDELSALGVVIVRHRVSFYDALAAYDSPFPPYLMIAAGAFLRVDIPALEDEEFILYTDCDVLFEREPDIQNLRPHLFSCAPEFNKEDFDHFNTGVMLMNTRTLREDLPDFTKFICRDFGAFAAFDQGAYQQYYQGRAAQLPIINNWKPYWGPSHDAAIIHFHGPKPRHARAFLDDPSGEQSPELRSIFNWSVEGYEYYVPKWEAYLE